MKERNPLRIVQDVLQHTQNSEEVKHQKVASTGLDPQIARVRELQIRRIARTYRDITAQPHYAPVMKFFLEDLYAPRDFTQRNHDARRAHGFLKRFVPSE